MAKLGFRETLESGGWILAFGNGFGNIVHQMLPFLSFTFASMIAVLALNTFVLTTLDTAVRITRFLVQESLGDKIPAFKNKFVVTVAVVFAAYLIGATDGWQKIWPIFGATNQLIAAVALFVVATWLMAVKKPTQYVLYPAIFMLITTIGALGWQAWRFFTAPEPNLFLGITAVVLIALAVFIGNEGMQALRGKRLIIASGAEIPSRAE
jgi:carbon starvation protein